MEFTPDAKRSFLIAFTQILKKIYGKGPNNIYIKYFPHKIHIVIQGVISHYERHIILNFNQEAIEALTVFYEKDCKNVEQAFMKNLDYRYSFDCFELESDFINDIFIYKMNIINKD